jgi:hypothetical protein
VRSTSLLVIGHTADLARVPYLRALVGQVDIVEAFPGWTTGSDRR